MIKKKFNIGDLVTDGEIIGNIYDYRKKNFKFIYYVKTKFGNCYIIDEKELRLIK